MMQGIEKGKYAIVTGGTRGIGLAIAEALLEQGVGVLVTGRNPEKGKRMLADIKGKYEAPCHFVSGDMGDEKFCAFVADEAIRLFGKVDYLVNNAFPFTAKYLDAERKDWLHVMEAGPIAYATMIAEYVRVHGLDVPGAVVCVSSISQYIAQPKRWTYNTAKGAVGQLVKCAAMDLAPHIRVNSVSPGAVMTDECDYSPDHPHFKKMHLIDRVIMPKEVAWPVLFLLSDDASAITAADLPVDGGFGAIGAEGKYLIVEHKGSN